MKVSRTRWPVRLLFTLMMALVLVAGLVGGCAADEPATNETPGTGTGSETPSDDGSGASGTRPAGELPEGATHTVADILDTPSDGVQVTVVGEIVQMIDAENFTLKDTTGEIYVDGDNDFGTLAAGDMVAVTGTVKAEDSPTNILIEATAVERR